MCLVTLGKRHFLKVFKIAEAGTNKSNPRQRIDCGKQDFIEDILAFSGEEVFIPVDDNAVYVSHERCKAINPFWTWADKKLVIPGDDADGDTFPATLQCIATDKPFQRTLSYWMVKILRETYKFGNDYQPMWYPLQLLLATAVEENEERKRPYGSLVEMASTKSVGKTILTLQVLNQALYRNGRGVTIRDYFYPNADLKDVQLDNYRDKFYREVFYHSMWSQTPISRPFGTVPSPGDLRAVFIQPVLSEDLPAQTHEATSDGRIWRTINYFAGSLKVVVKAILIPGSEGTKKNEKTPAPKLEDLFRKYNREYWSPIIFYDTAGELQQNFGPVTKAVRELTNKLAICIDAREIFNRYEPLTPEEKVMPVSERKNASIKHAYKRLREREMTPRRKKAVCIVITKLDLVLSATEKEEVKAIAEDSEGDEAAKTLLNKWLRAHDDDDKQNLRSLLTKQPPLVNKVFFVWTENLPRMRGVRRSPIKSIEPESALPGTEVFLEAETDFDFERAKKVTFNGKESKFDIESKQRIRATVPEDATSGLVGILLGAKPSNVAQTPSDLKDDDATSTDPFIVLPSLNSDVSKPRTYGLIKFLAWCLDKKVEEISSPTND
jgi:hypothetical protein